MKRQTNLRSFKTFSVKSKVLAIVKIQTVQAFAEMICDVDLKLIEQNKSKTIFFCYLKNKTLEDRKNRLL